MVKIARKLAKKLKKSNKNAEENHKIHKFHNVIIRDISKELSNRIAYGFPNDSTEMMKKFPVKFSFSIRKRIYIEIFEEITEDVFKESTSKCREITVGNPKRFTDGTTLPILKWTIEEISQKSDEIAKGNQVNISPTWNFWKCYPTLKDGLR